MSVFMPADHHATFDGWSTKKSQGERNRWSSRKRVAFLALSMIASWLLVLSPLVLFS